MRRLTGRVSQSMKTRMNRASATASWRSWNTSVSRTRQVEWIKVSRCFFKNMSTLTRLFLSLRQLSGNDDTHRDGGPYRWHAHHPVPSRYCSVLPAHLAPEWPTAAVRPWDCHRALARHHNLQQVCFPPRPQESCSIWYSVVERQTTSYKECFAVNHWLCFQAVRRCHERAVNHWWDQRSGRGPRLFGCLCERLLHRGRIHKPCGGQSSKRNLVPWEAVSCSPKTRIPLTHNPLPLHCGLRIVVFLHMWAVICVCRISLFVHSGWLIYSV